MMIDKINAKALVLSNIQLGLYTMRTNYEIILTHIDIYIDWGVEFISEHKYLF